jgi:hypothetical protein
VRILTHKEGYYTPQPGCVKRATNTSNLTRSLLHRPTAPPRLRLAESELRA